jgi:hypothetical protein
MGHFMLKALSTFLIIRGVLALIVGSSPSPGGGDGLCVGHPVRRLRVPGRDHAGARRTDRPDAPRSWARPTAVRSSPQSGNWQPSVSELFDRRDAAQVDASEDTPYARVEDAACLSITGSGRQNTARQGRRLRSRSVGLSSFVCIRSGDEKRKDSHRRVRDAV